MRAISGLLAVLVILLPFYLSTLQTIPNGSDDYYMRDVGETQVVLNTWGTLHATGYPLYVMTGNVLVAIMRAAHIAPATAPSLVSLLWSLLALGLIYWLAIHLTERILPAMVVVLWFGLTRTVWIHGVIAEIYSFGLAILALLFLLALWRTHIPNRVYWLAFIGGIGVFHHRALLMAAPALVYAVWPELSAEGRKILRTITICLLIGLIGFLPYAYLPLRAQAGAAWVYGQPTTVSGFLDEFLGREAEQYIGLPESWDGLFANANRINTVLVTDLTLPGLIAGIVGLVVGLRHSRYRRPAISFIISGGTAYIFHVTLYTDVLSALILPVTLSMAFGWLFLADLLIERGIKANRRFASTGAILLLTVLGIAVLTAQNRPFITDLTTDTTGLDTIALVQDTPPGATLMLPWSVRYHAVGFARDVLGELGDIQLVDHKADFGEIAAQGMLVTPAYTFYNQPVSWWEERLGTRVYLRAVAPYLVQIDTQPEHVNTDTHQITSLEDRFSCHADTIALEVAWYTPIHPDHDLSVFVYLLDTEGNLLAQGDQSAPVYGWRPLTTWEAGEVVRDVYVLPRMEGGTAVQYGLYQQLASGAFQHELEREVQVDCDD